MVTTAKLSSKSPERAQRSPGKDHRSGGLKHVSTPQIVRSWFLPMAVVVVSAFLFTTAFYVLDVVLLKGTVTGFFGVVDHYLAFTPELITDALPALGTTIVAALGIVLTVIAIIVQLSAERYTGVAMMFLRDPVHIAILSFYVVSSLCALWLSVTLRTDFVPLGLMLLVMTLASAGLAMMLPYFAYTFWFLEPGNIIARLRMHATRISQLGMAATSSSEIAQSQARLIERMEEITDIANNSIEGQDKIVTGHAVDALRDFVIDYAADKPRDSHDWYRIADGLKGNLDFVGMDAELMSELEARRLWVEWKMLHEYAGIYEQALGSMEDVNSLIAANTRNLGEVAASTVDEDLIRMVCRFMNFFMGSAIDAGHPRTCCNVLLQYRIFLAELLRRGLSAAACEGVGFMRYYGQIAFEKELPTVTETVAYDIAALCRHARQHQLRGEVRILRLLLDLDSEAPIEGYQQQRSLRGVRSAQTNLALYYMTIGDQDKARMIADDMREMPLHLREAVREDLTSSAVPRSWEIVDRGRNLHFLTEEEQGQVDTFVGWLAQDMRQ